MSIEHILNKASKKDEIVGFSNTSLTIRELVEVVSRAYKVEWTPTNEKLPNTKVYWQGNAGSKYKHTDWEKAGILTSVVQSLVDDGIIPWGNVSINE